jgi:hypothetical protein
MVSIRPFEEGDNYTLLDIDKLCLQGNKKRRLYNTFYSY